jgi:hypothetical protein
MENNPGSPEYLAVWQGQNDGEDFSQIYAQRLNCNGQSLPNQSLLKLSTDNLDQRSPAAIYLAREERYLVVWSGWTADDGYDIYAHSVETGLDIVPPVLNETLPMADAVQVHPDTALTIWFNEPILTGSFGLHTDPPLTFIQPYQWTPDNQTVTVTPTTRLAWEQQYVITVTGQDLSNNSVLLTADPILGPNPWSFTTRSKPYSYLPSVYRTFCWPFGLLKNGKFECGRDASSELFGWTVTEENGQNVDLLCQDDGYGYNSLNLNQDPSCVVRLGEPTYGYGPTGGSPSIPNGAATISQAVSLPASGTPSLRFDAYYCSYDQAEFQGKPRDSLEIYVQGQKLAQIGYNTALIQQPASPRCKLESPTISLAQYAGQTVTITFMLWNREHIQPQPDLGYLSTWAYLDNIDVQ